MINHCDDGRARGRALLLAPALLTLAVAAFGQNPELLPTVKLRPAASAPAPTTDCATGLAAAAPRLEIEPARPPEMPRAVERATAASRDTSTLLRRVQDAAEANDRTAFKDTLESARAGVRNLDSGTQRTRADEILKVYDDIQRVWDYSFATPTGSFFSAESQGGTLLAAMSRYPAYTDFIRKQSLVDQEHERFYPTRETRAFLTTQAEQMLRGARLGTVAGTKTRVAGSEPGRSASASRKSVQGGGSSSPDRQAHRPSTGTKSLSSNARPRAPKSHTTAGERSGSASTPTPTPTPTPKIGSGRGSNRTHAETPHPMTAASAGMPRSAGRRPQSEPNPPSSPPTRKPVRGPSSIPAASLPNEPQKQPAPPSATAVTTSFPLPGSKASSGTTSASGSSSAPTTAPSGTSTMSGSGTSSTTSSISSSTSGSETTGAAETTTSAGTPTQRTSEPPVPSGGRTYLSILMVVIGLIVLIVLIRASK